MRKQKKTGAWRAACAAGMAAAFTVTLPGQQAALPAAPQAHLLASAAQSLDASTQTTPGTQPGAGPSANQGPNLTIEQAEQTALRNNPNVSVARLLALAQAQGTREARSAELPAAAGDLTAVGAHLNSRITAGSLNNPTVFDRAAGGLTVSQLITDFGRTHNLVKSAQSNAKAQLESEKATELDVKLTVDQAFYQALTAQAVLRVAQQTVAQRQATGDQVGALTRQKIKSDLDLSFANVQLSQANLMLVDARSNEQAAMAALNDLLGSETDQLYSLVDEADGNPPPPPQDPEPLVQAAMSARPDLAALNDQSTAAKEYSAAERDLWMPTVSALAAAGGTPVRSDQIQSSWYGAAGANISIPLFNGFLFNAETKEARLRAEADQEKVRTLRNEIARDVRTTVLNAQAAFQRIGVTGDMLKQSNLALDLAQARYKIGLSSIVELTQAQLAETEAEIENTSAKYAYETALAEVRYQLGQ